MEAKSMKLFWILSISALLLESVSTIFTRDIRRSRDSQTFNNALLLKGSYINNQNILFNVDQSCPGDCECTAGYGYRKANCKRLQMGPSKFGKDITELEINNAKIDIQLDDFIFEKLGLSQIEKVRILNSNITSVGANAFHDLSNLYAVNLSNNKLKNIHSDTFATNKKLLLLTLSHNPLKLSASLFFINSSSVQDFDISYGNMRYINNNTFINMPGVRYLNLAGNNLSEVGVNSFKALSYLTKLDLSNNNIKSFPKNSFSENPLTILYIQRNPIDSLLGLQISNLVTLNAGETNIKFIGPSMFNGMRYIASLNLSGNRIEKIHNQAFHNLVKLNCLDLSFNNLDVISELLINKNILLNIFKISSNPRLKYLPANGFNCSAKRFLIKQFDASNCGLEGIYEDSLKTFHALTQINLSRNKIQSINKGVFSRSPYLTEINLAYNLLTTLDKEVFEINSNLQTLNLQGNPLKVFPVEVFVHTPMLTWLDMSHAELTGLWKIENNQKLFDSLRFLNVSHNHINEIKQIDLLAIKNLWTLDITNNPLACTEEFKNTINYLSSRYVSLNNNEFPSSSKEPVDIYTWADFTGKICGASQSSTSTPRSVIQTTDADEDRFKLKLENVLDDSNLIGNTEIINGTEQNKYNQDEETDNNEHNTNDDYNETIDFVLPVNDTIPEQLNSVGIPNSNTNTENSHIWPIIVSVINTILILIIVIICVKYVYKRRMSRRTYLMHQRLQDSHITSSMPLLATYTNIPPQENGSMISANL